MLVSDRLCQSVVQFVDMHGMGMRDDGNTVILAREDRQDHVQTRSAIACSITEGASRSLR